MKLKESIRIAQNKNICFILIFSCFFIMERIIKNINNFFKNGIFEIYKRNKNKKSRERQIKISDMLKYLFLYANKETTKEIAADTTKCATRTAFNNKLKIIDISFFEDLFNELVKLKENLIKDDNELLKINNILNNKIDVLNENSLFYNICSADGTCNNEIKNGTLFTNSSVHIYNNTKQEPYCIINNDNDFNIFDNNKNNTSNKNKEVAELLKFIDSKSDSELSKIILILDRAYSTYELILKLNERNIKYIIRLKENFDILKEDYKHSANIKKINTILSVPNVKIIKNPVETDNEFILGVTETKTIRTQNNYYLITNLGDAKDFNNNLIIDLYRYRWEIEVYFKKIKELFKYQTFYLNDNNEIAKMKIISNIVYILVKLLILISLKYDYDSSILKLNKTVNKRLPVNLDLRKKENKKIYNDYTNSKTYEAKVTINFNHFYKKFSGDILINLIDGNLDLQHIKILNKAIKVSKDKQNRKYKRKSLIPFTKWYVKMYHKIYQDKKIYEAIISGTTDKLNKNLKLKAEQILRDLDDSSINQ